MLESEKDMFLKVWERESQITIKYLAAYPADKLDRRVSEDMPSARDLAWSFVNDEYIIESLITGQTILPDLIQPATLEEILCSYKDAHLRTIEMLRDLPQNFFDGFIQASIGSKQAINDRLEIDLNGVLVNHVYRRGVFAVCLQIAGGSVQQLEQNCLDLKMS
jgi:hypothetical protein